MGRPDTRRPVSLGGLGYCGSGYEDAAPLRETNSPRPRILLAHDPTCVLYLDDLDRIDLLVCGHTHGGQVHLPFVGAPWTPSPAYPTYYRGLKALTPRSYIYVSRAWAPCSFPCAWGLAPGDRPIYRHSERARKESRSMMKRLSSAAGPMVCIP